MSNTIGHLFKGYDSKIYRVTEHDPRIGYWLEELGNPENRKDISERAIGRTFHHHKMCECSTGLEYPDGLTAEEYELLSVFDAGAFDLARASSRDRNEIPPMWLCMSDEARQEAREQYLAKLIEQGVFSKGKTLEDAQRFINSRVWYNEATEVACLVSLWRKAEAEAKNQRKAGNPRAYFAG